MIRERSLWVLFIILILICSISPVFAPNPANQQVTVTVRPTISIETLWNGAAGTANLGSFNTLGTNNTFIGNQTLRTYSNVPINVTVRVSGNLTGTNASNAFALNNFGYHNFYAGGNPSFPTTATLMQANWAKAPRGSYNSISINLWLYIPYGQPADTYTNTIYYTAIQA